RVVADRGRAGRAGPGAAAAAPLRASVATGDRGGRGEGARLQRRSRAARREAAGAGERRLRPRLRRAGRPRPGGALPLLRPGGAGPYPSATTTVSSAWVARAMRQPTPVAMA